MDCFSVISFSIIFNLFFSRLSSNGGYWAKRGESGCDSSGLLAEWTRSHHHHRREIQVEKGCSAQLKRLSTGRTRTPPNSDRAASAGLSHPTTDFGNPQHHSPANPRANPRTTQPLARFPTNTHALRPFLSTQGRILATASFRASVTACLPARQLARPPVSVSRARARLVVFTPPCQRRRPTPFAPRQDGARLCRCQPEYAPQLLGLR